MTTLTSFKELKDMIADGEREKAVGMARADAGASPEWKAQAREAVLSAASDLDTFTSDDVWARLSDQPEEPRALGPVMAKLRNDGLIEATDAHRLSIRPKCHRRPVRVWKGIP